MELGQKWGRLRQHTDEVGATCHERDEGQNSAGTMVTGKGFPKWPIQCGDSTGSQVWSCWPGMDPEVITQR